jgi:selenide,water dikinase
VLGEVLRLFKPPVSDRLLVGIEGVDDAGVYQLTEDIALVQTVDFFPPIVDDPFAFGQVAAANALSDVYAMGGQPITALNIIGFPAKMDPQIIGQILSGGADKIAEAEAVIAGGHSVKDNELKYGLAVTGLIHPSKIIANSNAQVGDRLILTKPIGTGIVSTAVKQKKAGKTEESKVVEVMSALNKIAAEEMIRFEAHAATDVTGFGLGGHSYEMASGSKVSIEISFKNVILLPGAIEYAESGALTGGANANRQYLDGKIHFAENFEKHVHDIIYDAQTSGGLLIAVAEEKSGILLESLLARGVEAAEIGRVIPKNEFAIYIKE